MDALLCSYRNCSERLRIIRCCGPGDFFLERVVFPFEVLTFHCPPASDVEVWAKNSVGVVLTEQLSADAMAMQQDGLWRRPQWFPRVPSRAVGVKENASSVCLLPR